MSEANEDLSYVEISCIHIQIDLKSAFLVNFTDRFWGYILDVLESAFLVNFSDRFWGYILDVLKSAFLVNFTDRFWG